MKTLCLIAANYLSHPPPAQLQELFKTRAAHQIAAQNPWLEVKMDKTSCDQSGTYDFKEDVFEVRMPKSIASENPTLLLPYEDLFEGYKVNMAPLPSPPPEIKSKTPQWMWWGLGIAAGAGILYWATRSGPANVEAQTVLPEPSQNTPQAPTQSRPARKFGAIISW